MGQAPPYKTPAIPPCYLISVLSVVRNLFLIVNHRLQIQEAWCAVREAFRPTETTLAASREAESLLFRSDN